MTFPSPFEVKEKNNQLYFGSVKMYVNSEEEEDLRDLEMEDETNKE